MSFLAKYGLVILFYVTIIAVVYFKRQKFEFQAKFIALYRTQIGIKLMHWFADMFGPIIRVSGYIGIFAGYIGMGLIVYFIFSGFYKLFTIPDAPATIALVLPGIPIPGSPVLIPFWYGITALFFVVVVHEFSHGVVSAAHKIKVKNSGIVFFGPLIGAFVEPDEPQLKKKNWWVQQSLFSAGPVSNGLLAVVVMVLLLFVFFPLQSGMVVQEGFYFGEVTEGYPALEAGLQPKTTYNLVNGVQVNNKTYLEEILSGLSPGDELVIANENLSHTIITTNSPDNPENAFIGVLGIYTDFELKAYANKLWFDFVTIISKFLQWVFILSIGIGLANLLPIGPVDGGRMFFLSLQKLIGKKWAASIFSRITALLLMMILIMLVVPIFRAVF